MSARSWKRLHKVGVYAVWLLATYIYQGSARGDRDALHVGALLVLLAAWLLRVAAWEYQRLLRRAADRRSTDGHARARANSGS